MRIRHLLAGGLACVCAAASAQPVGLLEVQRAAAGNVDVALARRALAAARADIVAADHAPPPQLTAKASQMDLQHGLGGGDLIRDKRIDKSLGIDWTLERGGKRALRTRAALANAGAARADLQEAILEQQIAASNAFWDLFAAQEKLAQVQAIAASAEQLAQTAQRRVSAGDLSRQDAARVEIEAERARADARAAQADRSRAAIALVQVTGLEQATSAAGEWPQSLFPGGAVDIEARADVRAARERVEAGRRGLDNALALRKTDLTVGASYDHFPGTSTRLVELRVQVPLAGEVGYAFAGEIDKARAQLAQAEDQLEKTRRAAAAETRRLDQDLREAGARAASYRDSIVPRAREVARMAEYSYAHGALSLTDLIDARRTLRAVLLEEIDARAAFARALTNWQLRGRESPEID